MSNGIRPLAELEREAILKALYFTRGNVMRAARELGISLRCIRMKIVEYRKEQDWVIPCQCQFGRPNRTCANHPADGSIP